MARKKPDVWGCGHPMPIEIVSFVEGRFARCLACGQCGPVQPNAEGALRALRGESICREKTGAREPPLTELRSEGLLRSSPGVLPLSGW